MDIQKKLLSMADEEYKKFNSKLIPTVPDELIIGIRTPILRQFAKDIAKTPEAEAFLDSLPHKYYEENNLHMFLIEQIKDFNKALYETEKFLPYIDNWASCDSRLNPVFKKNALKLLPKINEWLKSEHTYTVRYAIGLLMRLFLDEEYDMKYPGMVAQIRSDEYYINMMIAWYFATALAKQYESVIPYITEHRLDKWTHNKAIQKAIESYRIDDETKQYLRGLKR